MLNSTGTRWDRLRSAARRDGLPVLQSGLLRESTMPDGCDLIIAAHSHDFISAKTRAKTALGAIGYHPSLLPLHRGRDAVRWTIKNRDRVTGGTTFWLNDQVDAGDICLQEHIFVRPTDTAETLWRERLFPLGLKLLRQSIDRIASGLIIAVPQEHGLATWEPSIGRAPLFRPDLPQIGPPPEGYTVRKQDPLAEWLSHEMAEAHGVTHG